MTSNPDVPPFIGYVETTVNALRLIHAARQGVIPPRITRRLNDSERRTMIKSGAVFVFCVQESQIKKWTDGLLWSPPRTVGDFLVYREINKRTSSRVDKTPYPHDGSPTQSLTGKSSAVQGFRANAGSDQGIFKAGGLIKKTITVVTQESGPEPTHLHLISYYTLEDIRSGKLKRPSTRLDIMNLYMPPNIFRVTTSPVPPKVEIGLDGKTRLVEAEDIELVECKVEESGRGIPASPTWPSQGSPTSPVENPFHGSSVYPFGSGHSSTSSSVYGGRILNDKRPGPNDGSLHRQDMPGWSPLGPALSSGHTMSHKRDGSSVIQSETWPLLNTQSGRWQGQSHESSSASDSSGSGLYPERPKVPVRANYPYDDSQIVLGRRDHESMAQNFPLRYPPRSAGTREGALQRLHWHSRDRPDSARDQCNPHSTQNSFSSSFSSQGYTPTYTSWTSTVSNLMTTPVLHSIAQSCDGSYSSNSASIPSPDEFTDVDFCDS